MKWDNIKTTFKSGFFILCYLQKNLLWYIYFWVIKIILINKF
jgi:hypothetical protein